MTASPECAANERADLRDALESGRHALFADSGQEWRDALLRLIGDAERRRGLVEESKKLIEQLYGSFDPPKPWRTRWCSPKMARRTAAGSSPDATGG